MKKLAYLLSCIILVQIIGLASCQKEGVETPSSAIISTHQHGGSSFKNGNGYEYLLYIPSVKKLIGGNSWVLDSSGGFPIVTLTDSLDVYDSTDVKSLTPETGTSYTPPMTPCATIVAFGLHWSVYCGTPHVQDNGAATATVTCTGGGGFCLYMVSPIVSGTHYTGRIQPSL
jgi:hypothetical protein